MLKYWVYENRTHKRTRIHRLDCSYCNDGRGTQAGHSGRNDKWHGPFADRARALCAATRMQQADTNVGAACGA